MRIYDRLLLSTFLEYLAYTLAGSLVVFVLCDVFEHLGSLLDNQATAWQIARYYTYKAAWILDLVLPVALLLATLFTVGSMARYLELTALHASGLSLLQVTRSLIAAGFVFMLASFAWHEEVLPKANARAWRVWEVEIHKKDDRAQATRQLTATGSDGRIYYVERFDPTTKEIVGLKVVEAETAAVQVRLDVDRATWDGTQWTLHGATRRRFTGDREEVVRFEKLDAPELTLAPESLARHAVRYENMNIRELIAHQRLVEQTGGDPTTVRVDIQFHLAFPLVNMIVVFLGIILASDPRKTTIASGFGWTLLVGFGYYVLMNYGRALGQRQVMTPVIAAWAGNVIYAACTWVLYRRAKR
jgi:lipopolysaccharide export system permease protein